MGIARENMITNGIMGMFCKGVPGNCILYIIFQGPELMNTKMCNKK